MPESKDAANSAQDLATQPGTVINPSLPPQPVVAAPQPVPQQVPQPIAQPPLPIAPQPQPAPQPIAPEQTAAEPVPPTQLEQPEQAASAAETSEGAVSWTASEFVAHDKTSGWYLSLAVAAVILSALIYLISRDAVSVAVVIVAAIVLGSYGARKPRLLDYRVDQRGITIGDKHRGFGLFKSYTVVPEGALSSIELMPLKRFAPLLTIYFAPEDEEKIVAILSTHLPYEEPRRDAVDSLMRRIRF